MFKSTGLYFTCQIGNLSDDTLETTNFSMTEGLSELFTLSVTLVSARDDINVHEYLLQPVSFTITVDGIDQRIINGVISAFEQGDTGFRRTYYYLTVRPTLWVLSLNQDSRIFHKKSVPQLLDELIQPFCVQGRNLLMKESHPVHEYVTQKRESSWDFFNRLASQEGITYWFDQEGPLL
ncbi:contractile injection system protein, VgrG/Pvc8 family [Enterobacter soli]